MTDDQLDRLLKALSEPTDMYMSLGIALVAALVGFGLGLIADLITRSREKAVRESIESASVDAERKAAARAASAWAIRLAVVPGAQFATTLYDWSRDSGEIVVRLGEHQERDAVSGWLVRQMTILMSAPAAGESFTMLEYRTRSVRAMGVRARLAAWARGDALEAEFLPAHDAEWDNKLPQATDPAVSR